jgi:hypothetical protein
MLAKEHKAKHPKDVKAFMAFVPLPQDNRTKTPNDPTDTQDRNLSLQFHTTRSGQKVD